MNLIVASGGSRDYRANHASGANRPVADADRYIAERTAGATEVSINARQTGIRRAVRYFDSTAMIALQ